MNPLIINIAGLSLKTHHFSFSLDDAFMQVYGKGYLPPGLYHAQIALNKHETFIEGDFKITGLAHLVCDRSLEPFDFPLEIEKKVLFKYGEEEEELTDEITIISRERSGLDVGQLLYEFIGLAIPLKKLHPKFEKQDHDGDEAELVYTTATENTPIIEVEVDPRWEKLKKLK